MSQTINFPKTPDYQAKYEFILGVIEAMIEADIIDSDSPLLIAFVHWPEVLKLAEETIQQKQKNKERLIKLKSVY